jgi:hypothetical protein
VHASANRGSGALCFRDPGGIYLEGSSQAGFAEKLKSTSLSIAAAAIDAVVGIGDANAGSH